MRRLIGLIGVASVLAVGFPSRLSSHATIRQSLSVSPSADLLYKSTQNLYLELSQQTPQSVELAIPQTHDGQRFQQLMQEAIAHKWHKLSIHELMQVIAEQFIGVAYTAGLLDQSNQETLVVSLTQFDCVLFVETVLALARGIALQDYSYPTFTHHLQEQRYRNGHLSNYCSRLHYFSEWIDNNQTRTIVRDIASNLGGVPLDKPLNFMSTHRSSYPRLVNSEENYQCIVEMESNIEGVRLSYIPYNQIRRVYPQLKPGDIVGIATTIPGLDVTHTGLVYRTSNGTIGLIHASPIGRVTVAPDLQRYVGNVKQASGILVARPIDPRIQYSPVENGE